MKEFHREAVTIYLHQWNGPGHLLIPELWSFVCQKLTLQSIDKGGSGLSCCISYLGSSFEELIEHYPKELSNLQWGLCEYATDRKCEGLASSLHGDLLKWIWPADISLLGRKVSVNAKRLRDRNNPQQKKAFEKSVPLSTCDWLTTLPHMMLSGTRIKALMSCASHRWWYWSPKTTRWKLENRAIKSYAMVISNKHLPSPAHSPRYNLTLWQPLRHIQKTFSGEGIVGVSTSSKHSFELARKWGIEISDEFQSTYRSCNLKSKLGEGEASKGGPWCSRHLPVCHGIGNIVKSAESGHCPFFHHYIYIEESDLALSMVSCYSCPRGFQSRTMHGS